MRAQFQASPCYVCDVARTEHEALLRLLVQASLQGACKMANWQDTCKVVHLFVAWLGEGKFSHMLAS
eukprot:1151148-Pelagomonas_calceolata.AAC.4